MAPRAIPLSSKASNLAGLAHPAFDDSIGPWRCRSRGDGPVDTHQIRPECLALVEHLALSIMGVELASSPLICPDFVLESGAKLGGASRITPYINPA